MTNEVTNRDLNDRLLLIENMIAEGRRTTERWSWTFVLWGAAYFVAIAWSAWGHDPWAWPVTMSAAVLATVMLIARKSNRHPDTTLGRAVGSIWTAMGVSMFLLFLAMGATGKLADMHTFVAVASGFLGMANSASSMLLRWKTQFACAVIWWAASILACFGSAHQTLVIFLVAIFLCQIVFGVYGMMREARARKAGGTAHA